MELVFTRDCGRFSRGDVRDYPAHVWRHMEESLGKKLKTFTRPVDEALQSAMKKPGNQEAEQ